MHLGSTVETGGMLKSDGEKNRHDPDMAIYSHLWPILFPDRNQPASEDRLPINHPSMKPPILLQDRTRGWWETKHVTINNLPHSLRGVLLFYWNITESQERQCSRIQASVWPSRGHVAKGRGKGELGREMGKKNRKGKLGREIGKGNWEMGTGRMNKEGERE